jgi:hypothetical protein
LFSSTPSTSLMLPVHPVTSPPIQQKQPWFGLYSK